MQHTNTDPDIPIVFEDEHLLVIDKPHDVLSQEDDTNDPDVLTLCKSYLAAKVQKQGNLFLGLVHRLDRPTGGLMMFAKTSNAARFLAEQLKKRTIQKTYWAVIYGHPPSNGVLTHYLRKDRNLNRVEVKPETNPEAKKAVLSYQRLQQNKELSLLAVHLQTGRPHQVRVQLSEENFPVWGDYKYGSGQPDGRTLALRAVELTFRHPANKELIELELFPPLTEPWSRFPVMNHTG